jgi:D-erythro-7,8-dihydroneopterin triphosphate epimerase
MTPTPSDAGSDAPDPLDLIHIRDLRLRARIGVNDWEKKALQDVIVNVTLHHDQRDAAAHDDIHRTVDYKGVRDRIVAFVEDSRFELLEALSERIAAIALEDGRVQAVDVTVDKPRALRYADSVAVQIHRSRTGTTPAEGPAVGTQAGADPGDGA